MSLPAVAIILPLGLAPELTEAVLHNCNLAIGAGACSLTSSTDSINRDAWLARVVQPTDSSLAVQVELGASPNATHGIGMTRRRSLSFDEGERAMHQWSAVGVVIAALAIAAEAERNGERTERAAPNTTGLEDAKAPKPSTTENPASPGQSNRADAARQRTNATPSQGNARLDLGAILTPGLDSRHPRYGFTLRPALKLGRRWLVQGQFIASRADGNVTTRAYATEVGIGIELTAPSQPWAIEARASAYAEALHFAATNIAGEHDAAWRSRLGAAAGLDVIVPFAQHWGWFVAIEGQLTSPRIRVQVASREVANVSAVTVLGTTGLRFSIDTSH